MQIQNKILWMLVFYGPLIGLFVVWMVPLSGRLQRANREIVHLREQVRQRDLLSAFAADLRLRSQDALADALTLPERQPLPAGLLPTLEERFRQPADTEGVTLTRFAADAQTLKDDYRSLSVALAVQGTPAQARGYLMAVCRLPELMRFAVVRVRRVDEAQVEMAVDLVLSIS